MDDMQLDVQKIVSKYKLQMLVYFGSYMTENYHKESDIDIAYLSENPLIPIEKIGLLEDLIIAHRKSEIDLVDLRTAEPVLRCEIAINGKLLYEKEDGLFDRYYLYYIKRFYELKPVIDEEMNGIRKAIKEVIDNA